MKVTFKSKWYHLRKTEIEFYEGADDLPPDNYSMFQQLAMLEAGVGSDMASFSKHMGKVLAYVTHDEKEKALQEFENMYIGFWNALQKTNTKAILVIPFIESIDGKKDLVKSNNLDECKETLKLLTERGMTMGHINSIVEEASKKLLASLEIPFQVQRAIIMQTS